MKPEMTATISAMPTKRVIPSAKAGMPLLCCNPGKAVGRGDGLGMTVRDIGFSGTFSGMSLGIGDGIGLGDGIFTGGGSCGISLFV